MPITDVVSIFSDESFKRGNSKRHTSSVSAGSVELWDYSIDDGMTYIPGKGGHAMTTLGTDLYMYGQGGIVIDGQFWKYDTLTNTPTLISDPSTPGIRAGHRLVTVGMIFICLVVIMVLQL